MEIEFLYVHADPWPRSRVSSETRITYPKFKVALCVLPDRQIDFVAFTPFLFIQRDQRAAKIYSQWANVRHTAQNYEIYQTAVSLSKRPSFLASARDEVFAGAERNQIAKFLLWRLRREFPTLVYPAYPVPTSPRMYRTEPIDLIQFRTVLPENIWSFPFQDRSHRDRAMEFGLMPAEVPSGKDYRPLRISKRMLPFYPDNGATIPVTVENPMPPC